ncbi:aspartic-type endopeptidase opsB [Physcia stellaris]|nr:aspartic-type endopeptidase opsB [Physcia stellaris]
MATQDDVFARSSDAEDKPSESPTRQALNYLCQDLDLPLTTQFPVRLRTPIFIGHGLVDEKVSVKIGRQAASCPSALDVDVDNLFIIDRSFEIHGSLIPPFEWDLQMGREEVWIPLSRWTSLNPSSPKLLLPLLQPNLRQRRRQFTHLGRIFNNTLPQPITEPTQLRSLETPQIHKRRAVSKKISAPPFPISLMPLIISLIFDREDSARSTMLLRSPSRRAYQSHPFDSNPPIPTPTSKRIDKGKQTKRTKHPPSPSALAVFSLRRVYPPLVLSSHELFLSVYPGSIRHATPRARCAPKSAWRGRRARGGWMVFGRRRSESGRAPCFSIILESFEVEALALARGLDLVVGALWEGFAFLGAGDSVGLVVGMSALLGLAVSLLAFVEGRDLALLFSAGLDIFMIAGSGLDHVDALEGL